MVGSERIRTLSYEGGIREISERAASMEKAGRDIVHFEIGQPDSDSPQNAKDAAIDALRRGKVAYTPRAGISELRKALADLEETHGIHSSWEDVVVTCGAVAWSEVIRAPPLHAPCRRAAEQALRAQHQDADQDH